MAEEKEFVPIYEAKELCAEFVPIYEEQAANDLLLLLLQKHYRPSTIYPLHDDRGPAIYVGFLPLADDDNIKKRHELEKINQILEHLGLSHETPCILERDEKNYDIYHLIFLGNFKIKDEYKKILKCNICTQPFHPLTVDVDNFMCVDCHEPVCMLCSCSNTIEDDIFNPKFDNIILKYYVHCNDKKKKCTAGKYNFSATCGHFVGCKQCLSNKWDKCSCCEQLFCEKCIDNSCVIDEYGIHRRTRFCCWNYLCPNCLIQHNKETIKLKQECKKEEIVYIYNNDHNLLNNLCCNTRTIAVCSHGKKYFTDYYNGISKNPSVRKCDVSECQHYEYGDVCIRSKIVKCIDTGRIIIHAYLCCEHSVEDLIKSNKHKKVVPYNAKINKYYCYLHQKLHIKKVNKCAKCGQKCCTELMKQVTNSTGKPMYKVCFRCHLRVYLIGRCVLNRIIWKPGSNFVLRKFAELEDEINFSAMHKN